MQKNYKTKLLMVWFNIIKPLVILSQFYQYLSKNGHICQCQGNPSYQDVIEKTTIGSSLDVSKKTFLFMIFTPETFRIVILIIIPFES